MSFRQLPKELKSIVSEFCYKCSWEDTEKSLAICEKINEMNISPLFLRLQMWSWSYLQFLPNPLYVFRPISRLTGRWSDIIDWHAVNELLFRLDYRRKVVRIAGTRHEWFQKFRRNWMNTYLFDSFYRIIVASGMPCFKPLYHRQRVEQLTSWDSPFYSARWILNDYDTYGRN